MEEERVVDHIQGKSNPISSPSPSEVPSNWGILSAPAPQSISPSSPLGTSFPLPPSSAVHALQTKVNALTQRRPRGREREQGKERVDTELPVNQPAGQISSEVLLRQRARGKSQVSLPVPSWRSGSVKNSSSSEEEEEVEVQVRLEIHSPPAEAQGEQVSQGVMGKGEERAERNKGQVSCLSGQPRLLGEGASLENLLSDNSSSSEDDSPPPPPPAHSSSSTTTAACTTSSFSSSTSSTSSRHWAPPKGFWRVARPETLLLNRVGPHNVPSSLPLKDYTQRRPKPTEAGTGSDVGSVVNDSDAPSESEHSDSLCYLDSYEQKDADATDPVKGLCKSGSRERVSSQSGMLSADEKVEVKQRAYAKLKDTRRHNSREEREPSGGESSGHCGDETYRVDCKGAYGVLDNNSDSTILPQELEPCSRSLFVITDELPLSPRHEQAKRLLERARLKARSSHIKGDRPPRRSHSDQRYNIKKQQVGPPNPAPVQQAVVQTKEDLTAPSVSGPLLVPNDRDTSPGDQGGRSRQPYGCSPTRVRFEDESEKEAESRYLDRLRERGRPGTPKSKSKTESNTDSSSSGSERSRRSVSMPPPQRQEDVGVSGESATVIKEIIVVVKKCEACGSIVREPPSVTSEPQNTEPQQHGNPEDVRGRMVPRWVPPNKPEVSTRPKAPLTVTFAGAFVLGENKESGTGWKMSGFGKLRRRSRKGESRLESGHGPYGPSWAQRRNSNPRKRAKMCKAVSFAPGSPIALEPRLLEASGGLRESPTPSLPIKSALKSSSKNRTAAGQSTVQFQMTSNQGSDGGSQHLALLDSTEPRREAPMALSQGTPTTTSLVPCIRPSTLRYSSARLTLDLPAAELWDATPDGAAGLTLSGDPGSGSECHSALRSLAMSRAEDLRAELLRAEHLKAEAMWEDNSDGSRKSMPERDGRPKLSLRRFFSSIGLNSVGRLVKGGRSSSMEQLSIPTARRVSSASPSPTSRPQPAIRIQRTPSLQTLHTMLPLAQLRKASSVQSLERRTERSTILGEVQIPYGLAPSPDSPQLELHRALSVEDVLSSRVVRPLGRVTQVFPDGTLLLELIRPPNGPFGFVISRGKGHPDTGVYVDKVGDGAGEGLYVGLLSVGDEILQVNGEAVAGLSLDQVTRLMTRESIASLRIMPSRRNQH